MQPDSPPITGSWHFLMDMETAQSLPLLPPPAATCLPPFSPLILPCVLCEDRARQMMCVFVCVYLERFACIAQSLCRLFIPVWSSPPLPVWLLLCPTSHTQTHTQETKHLITASAGYMCTFLVGFKAERDSKCSCCGPMWQRGKRWESICMHIGVWVHVWRRETKYVWMCVFFTKTVRFSLCACTVSRFVCVK